MDRSTPPQDREGADFFKDVQMMVDQLGTNPVPIQLPIGKAAGFKGVYDLVEMRSIIWTGEELGANFEYKDEIPEGMEAREVFLHIYAKLGLWNQMTFVLNHRNCHLKHQIFEAPIRKHKQTITSKDFPPKISKKS